MPPGEELEKLWNYPFDIVLLISGESVYQELLEVWFPAGGKPPSAFLLDTSEEALFLPEWLRLRMIRSSSQPIINAGRFN